MLASLTSGSTGAIVRAFHPDRAPGRDHHHRHPARDRRPLVHEVPRPGEVTRPRRRTCGQRFRVEAFYADSTLFGTTGYTGMTVAFLQSNYDQGSRASRSRRRTTRRTASRASSAARPGGRTAPLPISRTRPASSVSLGTTFGGRPTGRPPSFLKPGRSAADSRYVVAASTSVAARARPVACPASVRLSRLWLLALAAVTTTGAVYHWLQSRGHVTPAVFTDELLFAELARSFAVGEGYVVRDQPLFFPAFAGPAAGARLARRLDAARVRAGQGDQHAADVLGRPARVLARATTHPAGVRPDRRRRDDRGWGMLYHGYLTSESVAYPVFVLAVAVSVRALAAPSTRRDAMAVAVLFLAVLTRAQFVVLPLVFLLAILLVGRPLKRQRRLWSLSAALPCWRSSPAPRRSGSTKAYGRSTTRSSRRFAGRRGPPRSCPSGPASWSSPARWSAWSTVRDRRATGRAFGVMTGLLLVLMPLQAGLIASGESHKPFERYAFYLVPLVFLAFFIFAERASRTGGSTEQPSASRVCRSSSPRLARPRPVLLRLADAVRGRGARPRTSKAMRPRSSPPPASLPRSSRLLRSAGRPRSAPPASWSPSPSAWRRMTGIGA